MMTRNKSVTFRVTPEKYKALLQKCADHGCSTYEYVRKLVYADIAGETGVTIDPVEDPKQTELIKENESNERRFDFRG